MRHCPLILLTAISGLMVCEPASAAPRAFTATLARVPTCAFAGANGMAKLTIDDASGAVTGTLTIAGFESGATISSAGIRNKAAGDNLVGGFDGADANAPNATHTVTTTLNTLALPKILAGDGSVAVFAMSSGSGCESGAIRGDLVEGVAGGPADAGTDASAPPAAGASDSGSAPGTPAGGTDGTAADASDSSSSAATASDDGGCSHSSGSSPAPGAAVIGLLGTALLFGSRRLHHSRLRHRGARA